MAVSFQPKHSRTSEYRFYPEDVVIKPELKSLLQSVIDTGKFPGIGGRECNASDDLIEFLAALVDAKKKGAAA